jgi:hypothetical protein
MSFKDVRARCDDFVYRRARNYHLNLISQESRKVSLKNLKLGELPPNSRYSRQSALKLAKIVWGCKKL